MNFAQGPIPLALEVLDRLFPPDVAARMSPDEHTRYGLAKAPTTMGVYLEEMGAWRAGALDVLDFGCGCGGETLWLAERVRSAHGVDVDHRAVAQARKARDRAGAANCSFKWSPDGRLPYPDRTFDAVFSTDTFTHVIDLELAFAEILRVLKPGGSLLTRFGPLFHSPHGCELHWACRVPYAHLLFGLDAIASLRAARGGSRRRPASWHELGLNARRFRDYAAAVERAGFEMSRFEAIPVKGLKRLAAAPRVGDLFIFGVDGHLRRA
jgi:SAM-dependent methyltransferase